MEHKINNYEKFYNLDILKSIAVVGVILIHIVAGELFMYGKGVSMKDWMLSNVINSVSRVCVPVFVMVSGYLLLRKDEPVGIFFKKRFVKIIPKFLIYSMIYYVFKVSFLNRPYSGNENFLMLLFKGGIFYHLWYIYMILGIYIMTPFFRKVVSNIHKSYIKYFVCVWAFFMIVIPFLEFVFKTKFMVYSPVGQYVGYFFIGYLIGEKPLKLNKIFLFLGYLFFLSLSIWLSYFFTVKNGAFIDFFYNYHSIGVFFQSVFLYGLIMKFSHNDDNDKGKKSEIIYGIRRFVSTLSLITLDVYLIHPMIISYFQEKTNIRNRLDYPFYIIIVFFVTAAISYIIGFMILKLSKLRFSLAERKL
ncbi:acyltransferase [Leptotrichia sp. OH3620_COT-345]|uniref:acyltransferase n=1 Tax=Leptotrichia sp. OH3620_COT-345 TaxID=2491048 RepID=UPI000F64C53C|nr:acyltransferase family protein [Leptotrichia sp. OH3620_COT-345]RRD38850.1 acyltransferase [Leptotrichia sp. OH3620_COT-345]